MAPSRASFKSLAVAAAATALIARCVARGTEAHQNDHVDPKALPNETLFPGPWERYIQAPANKSYITPLSFWNVDHNVTNSATGEPVLRGSAHVPGDGIVIGPYGELTLEFGENVAGR